MYSRHAVCTFVLGSFFLPFAHAALPGDADLDGDVDLPDLAALEVCLDGPGQVLLPRCAGFDNNNDNQVGLFEFGEFQRAFTGTLTPLTFVTSTSPAHGETGVAVTRETIVSFSGPIDPSSLNASNYVATFGGTSLPARVHVSADGLKATLFTSLR